MIEDNIINEEKTKNEKKVKRKGKGSNLKRKDLIIQDQNEIRKKKNIEDDMNKMNFLFENIDLRKPFIQMKNLKTDEGIMEFKFRLLDILEREE